MTAYPELSVDEIMQSAMTVADVVGRKWIKKHVEEEEQEISRFKARANDRRHAYMYRSPPHPLVRYIMDFERMRMEAVESWRLSPNQNMLSLVLLGQCLNKVKDLPGFDKFVPRLRGRESFYPAVFEIETAAGYVNVGSQVAFVPENRNEKTPDILVTRRSGEVFWVECKCRDGLNERDQKIAEFWVILEEHILRVFGPKKISALIIVKSLRDPKREDIPQLLSLIFASIEAGGLGEISPATGLHSPVKVLGNQFELIVQPLAAPDQEISGSGLELLGANRDRVTMLMESKVDALGKTWIKNPIILGFQNCRPIDKVRGLVGVFKSAASQLPKSGPGVVCIRLPNNFWANEFDVYAAEAVRQFSGELSGENNRRVNMVLIKSMMHEHLSDGQRTGIGLRPVTVPIEHKNPYITPKDVVGIS